MTYQPNSRTPLACLLLLAVLCSVAWGERPATLTGKLIVPEEAGTKNSYMTGNFVLIKDRTKHIITGSKKVSEDELTSFKDQFVTLEVNYVPAQAPDPTEQAPMGPEGPLDHPAYYEVLSIRAAKKPTNVE